MAAIASTPRSGRDPCAATPSVSTSSHRNPLCATQTSRPVGSVTMAASAQHPGGDRLAAEAGVLLVAHTGHDHVAAQAGVREPGRRRA